MHASHAPTATWETLQARARMLQQLRQFFDTRGFIEVETPILSSDTVVDRHLDPLPVTLFSEPTQSNVGPQYWLQTSPEFGMKRLLAAGAKQIYQVTRAFRAGEKGNLHNPEFTIVEWYRVGDDMQRGMQLLAELAEVMLDAAPATEMSYGHAFEQFVGIDPHRATSAELAACARSHGIGTSSENCPASRDDWLNLLLAERVEPQLGVDRPIILFDYPASQAALSRTRDEDPPVAERFELYVAGVELANGYHELLDAGELRRRNLETNTWRSRAGKAELPAESRMLEAMTDPGLPACCGVALGFDRLVMLALGAKSMDQVMAFPIDRA